MIRDNRKCFCLRRYFFRESFKKVNSDPEDLLLSELKRLTLKYPIKEEIFFFIDLIKTHFWVLMLMSF